MGWTVIACATEISCAYSTKTGGPASAASSVVYPCGRHAPVNIESHGASLALAVSAVISSARTKAQTSESTSPAVME